jgi:hypothetical protein
VNYEVLKFESGPGKKSKIHRRNIHLAAQGQANGIDNPGAQSIRSGAHEK